MIGGEAFQAACRYSGVRWAVATALSVASGLIAAAVLGYPPPAVDRWPREALGAAGSLMQAAHALQQAALVGWSAIAVRAWGARLRVPGLRQVAVAALLLVAARQSWIAAEFCRAAWAELEGLPTQGRECVVRTVLRAGIAPLGISMAPLLALGVSERLASVRLLRRLLKTGRGAAGGWMSALELKKHCRPLPRRQ